MGCGKTYALVHNEPIQGRAARDTTCGTFCVEYINVAYAASFLDYIQGGTSIRLITAIDFTASNGLVDSPNSLHYDAPHFQNEYMTALESCCKILQPYSSSNEIVAFGFGSKLPSQGGVVSHCFPLNGNWAEPQVDGISGLLHAYKSTLREIVLYGPAVFSEVIEEAVERAEEAAKHTPVQYQVLLIVTDGVIGDVKVCVCVCVCLCVWVSG